MLRLIEPLSLPALAVSVVACSPSDFIRVWHVARPFIEMSCARAGAPFSEADEVALADGKKTLWLVVLDESEVIGAGISGIYGQILRIHHFAGHHLHLYQDKLAVIEDYAKDRGCDRVLFDARLGWQRKLPGYRVSAVIMEKKL